MILFDNHAIAIVKPSEYRLLLLKHPIVDGIISCLSTNRKIQKKQMLFSAEIDGDALSKFESFTGFITKDDRRGGRSRLR